MPVIQIESKTDKIPVFMEQRELGQGPTDKVPMSCDGIQGFYVISPPTSLNTTFHSHSTQVHLK